MMSQDEPEKAILEMAKDGVRRRPFRFKPAKPPATCFISHRSGYYFP